MAERIYSTGEVAKLVGISKKTLLRWLEDGSVKEPKRGKLIGGIEARMWTKQDIDRAREFHKHRERRYTTRKTAATNAARWNQRQTQTPPTLPTMAAPVQFVDRIPVLFMDRGPVPDYRMEFRVGDELLTIEEVAKRLKTTVSWVYEYTRKRSNRRGTMIPHIKQGRGLRFVWRDVVDWLNTMEVRKGGC